MNKNLAITIGVIVVIVLAGVVMIPALFPPKTSMTVTFYDANDNVVWSEQTSYGLFEFGFTTEAGSEVTKAVVTVNYIVDGYDPANTIRTHCNFFIEAIPRGYRASPVGDASYDGIVLVNTPVGSFTHDFVFNDFMTVTQSGKDDGWRINVDATLECFEYYPNTITLVDTAEPWQGTLGFNLDWDEPAGFAIVGSGFNFGPT